MLNYIYLLAVLNQKKVFSSLFSLFNKFLIGCPQLLKYSVGATGGAMNPFSDACARVTATTLSDPFPRRRLTPTPSLSSPGWSSSARAWRRRPTTSSPPSPWSTPSASCSTTRCSSAAPAPAPNTSASAPAGTTAAARWRCAGTAYDQSGKLRASCSLIGHFKGGSDACVRAESDVEETHLLFFFLMKSRLNRILARCFRSLCMDTEATRRKPKIETPRS